MLCERDYRRLGDLARGEKNAGAFEVIERV